MGSTYYPNILIKTKKKLNYRAITLKLNNIIFVTVFYKNSTALTIQSAVSLYYSGILFNHILNKRIEREHIFCSARI